MIKLLVNVPIFNRAVFFVGGCSGADAEEAVYRLRKARTQVSFEYSALGCVREAGGDVFVWVRDLDRASVVAHELAHAACSIMDLCHIPLCRETEELMCYLIGWLKIHVQDRVYELKEKHEADEEKAQ